MESIVSWLEIDVDFLSLALQGNSSYFYLSRCDWLPYHAWNIGRESLFGAILTGLMDILLIPSRGNDAFSSLAFFLNIDNRLAIEI